MALESAIVSKSILEARRRGWFACKIHGNAYQLAGLPDILCIKDGRAAWMEAKRPGNKPTPVQIRRMQELRNAGCSVAVIHSAAEAAAFLEGVA